MPVVLVAMFIEEPTPFMPNFFETLVALDYPKTRMHLMIHNMIEYHEQHVSQFIAPHSQAYSSYELIGFRPLNSTSSSNGDKQESKASMTEWEAREYALAKCQRLNCDYLLSLDSIARLESPESLRILIETNRAIVAPLLSRPGKLWSNFWGSITRDGYYTRSADYVDLVSRSRIGVWNVPLIMNAYLIEGKFIRHHLTKSHVSKGELASNLEKPIEIGYYDAKYPNTKPALIFARNIRSLGAFQFVTNTHEFGHLVDPSDYNTSLPYPDFYQLVQNKPDWEREYLHENYTDLFDERDEDEKNYPNRIRLEEPCKDVYWFPLVSNKFADQLIDIMERFGQWSSGKNHDPRIEGGYESVPTRDIHFRQVGLHDMWLFFLREYVMPIQLKEYIGYEHDPPRTELAFVVRYHPSEQPSLRPHHDSSTYTLNIALNTPGVDYEGGGCRFVRYNCSVTESRKGWALIHPGRLTHYHEGLPVTNGTRYILVTFVDP
jgi:procollagen-lysine,2-oxoglutarate 5-dioxygenase